MTSNKLTSSSKADNDRFEKHLELRRGQLACNSLNRLKNCIIMRCKGMTIDRMQSLRMMLEKKWECQWSTLYLYRTSTVGPDQEHKKHGWCPALGRNTIAKHKGLWGFEHHQLYWSSCVWRCFSISLTQWIMANRLLDEAFGKCQEWLMLVSNKWSLFWALILSGDEINWLTWALNDLAHIRFGRFVASTSFRSSQGFDANSTVPLRKTV